jgi:prepilin-type N-terminal cleavage/methylation domain-containing protein
MSWKALLSSAAGFSLIELVIALTAGLVVLGAAYQGFLTHQKIYTVQEQVVELQQTVQTALAFMTRELRMAQSPMTLDPTAGTSTLTYVSALNLVEQRGFLRHSTDQTLYYVHGALGLPLDELAQTPLASPITDLTMTRTGPVVTIALTGRTASVDPGLGTYRTLTLQSQVLLRSP